MKIMVLILSWLAVVILAGLYFTQTPEFSGDINAEVNKIRQEYSLPPLKIDPLLNEVAMLKCNDMASRDYFSHEAPDGRKIWQQYQLGPYNKAGENLGLNYNNAIDLVDGWEASQTHLDNLIDPNYRKVGYGLCLDNNKFLIVQIMKG